MLKRFISAVIAITMVMGMCSCSEQPLGSEPMQPSSQIVQPMPSEPVEPSSDLGGNTVQLTADYNFSPAQSSEKNDSDFVNGISGFSVELFKNSVKQDLVNDAKNTLVSPESVAFALGMTMNGANGNTLKQMQDVMCGGVETDKFNKNMNLLISSAHNNNTEDSKLNIANSVWVKDRNDLVLNKQFAKNCKEHFNAEMFKAPFDSSTVAGINSWVNEKTDKMIPKLIDNFQGSEIMCLVNCIAFDSKWEKEYEQEQISENQKFTNAKNNVVDCTMLCSNEDIYVQNNRATGFVKNYKGGKYAFMAVLPNEGTDIGNYVASMSKDEIANLYESRTAKYDVITRLPKFSYDYSTELSNTLYKMGIKDAFSDDADFSKMFDNNITSISRVIHKTHIELDAKGTKAAAATAVLMKENAVAVAGEFKQVILDRPFVYAIMDTTTGLPVFLGTVCDPGEQ